jgi:hypothetical protein
MFEYFRQDEGHYRTSSYSGTESVISSNEASLIESNPLSPINEMHTGFGI